MAVIELSSKYRGRLAFFLVPLLASTVACDRSDGGTHSIANANPRPSAQAKASNPNAGQPSLPLCPAGGLDTVSLLGKAFGKHHVVLSWNASLKSSNPLGNAAGYCLYRSKNQNAAKKMPTCRDCERVTLAAIRETSCVDDHLEDGETYYYVVTALNERGGQSSPSNEIGVRVPFRAPIVPSSPHSAAIPSCRKPVDAP
jgi:hypothetical protein